MTGERKEVFLPGVARRIKGHLFLSSLEGFTVATLKIQCCYPMVILKILVFSVDALLSVI